jgi:DNA-binding IclR family transcriptional regulator
MSVKSATRVLEIFELLKDYPRGLTSKEISEKLGYPASSTFELIKTLSSRDYLTEDYNKSYTLGPKLIQLGSFASEFLDLNKLAQPLLQALMNKLEETVFLAVLSENEIVYVAKEDNYRSINTNVRIGSHKPLYCTGLGKAFLAFLPEETRKDILSRTNFVPYTKNTITNLEILEKQLEEFRRNGYSVDNEEIEEGLWCAAAPVFDKDHQVVAAISVSGPKTRMMENKEKIVQDVLDTSNILSNKLGYFK